jgi:membrane fusion protein (multidrug efflux system)
MASPDETPPGSPQESPPSGKGSDRAPLWKRSLSLIPERARNLDRLGLRRRPWLAGVPVVVLLAGLEGPSILRALTTISTDDAYVNGHVTFVAPRVPGQVARVLVDDNNRVRRGDLLVQLDKEPYQVQMNIAQAAVDAAQADLTVARAQTRGLEGQARSLRFNLQKAMEEVDNQVALLRAKVAALDSQKATLVRAQADFDREVPLLKSGVVSQQQYDAYHEKLRVARAQVEEAEQGVYQIRVGLGLPPKPPAGGDLAEVPADLDQTFSAVKEAQGKLIQAASQLGVTGSFASSPQQMLSDFYRRDPEGNIDRIFEQLAKDAPGVERAEAKLVEARRNLDEAQLNLRYCDVVAEIDGVVTRRSVNPGNNVVVGQALMAVRSLTDIWVDANFKETQLSELRIGQPVDLDVDMYGSRQRFHGRISGFTVGTGSTLALLPAENATGNFVKVVQRLPVRIDLIGYDPDETPLFIGLSVTPYVHVDEKPSGPNAGRVLQPYVDVAAPAPSPESAAQSGR